MKKESVWLTYSKEEREKLHEICELYKSWLDKGKTERECVELVTELAEKAGYHDLEEYLTGKKKIRPGEKIYASYMKKCIALFRMGERPISEGMNILGAHIDSPRIDVKQNPLYEEGGFAYLDTHYYGGIKKYQWVTQPLAIHGIAVLKDGSCVNISIGEKEEDPVFVITDLLVHLAGQQMDKKAREVIEGEKLDLLIGDCPIEKSNILKNDEKETIKKNILRILEGSYGIGEEDFASAELEIVPAGKARDLGFDRSMILAYGQDDRICAFTSVMAMLNVENSRRTACCLLVDKEEIGSVGATGMQSCFFENVIAELVALTEGESYLRVRRALAKSKMLSSDVSAAYDPQFADMYEKRSAAFLTKGLTFNKFTGSCGKNNSNDTNAEYLGEIRKIMEKAGVAYQFAELGKVDIGGGGTIAYIMANYGMDVIDSGVAILNMHAPYEVSDKSDIYQAVKAYEAFLKWGCEDEKNR